MSTAYTAPPSPSMPPRRIQPRYWTWLIVTTAVAGTAVSCGGRSAPADPVPTQTAPVATPFKNAMSYSEARPVLDAYRDRLPAELRTRSAAELESAWPEWARKHDADVRARLARGDEDSIVNFWM